MDDGANVADNNGFPKPEGTSTAGKGTGCACRRRRWRRVGLALALLLVAVAGALWAMWDRGPSGPPLVLTLPSGEKYQFAGTTYGTRNVPPSFEAKLVSALPARLANWARKRVGPQISQYNQGQKFDPPNLFVWFHRLGTNVPAWSGGPRLTARLADQAGIEAGLADYPDGFQSAVAWNYASFAVIPRRSRVLQLNFYPFGGVSVSIPNPLYGNYPQWKPEPVPAVKKGGDLEVRLNNLGGYQVGGGPIVIVNQGRVLQYRGGDTVTRFDVTLSSTRGTNETWALHCAELSDATGNVLRQESRNVFLEYHIPPKPSFTSSIPGTLWPDEAAWRLKLEFKRASGFAPEEIVTFKDVPVPAVGTTNYPGLTMTAGGIRVVLTKFVRYPNIIANAGGMYDEVSQVTFELPGKPKGVAMDFLEMKADAGEAEKYGSEFLDFGYVVCVESIPANAKTMDFTFVVQKTRSVEFLVQPPKPE